MRRAEIVLTLLCIAASGCGSSSSVATTSPSAAKCDVSADGAPRSFPAEGGAGSLTISTTRECTWAVRSEASWLAPARTTGQGDTTLPFRVTSNPSPSTRRAGLTVESVTVEFSQEGAPCTFHLDPTRAEVDAAGGHLQIAVTAMTGCSWTARSRETWVAVDGNAQGDGGGTVNLSVGANTGGARQGAVFVADQTVTIAQKAFTPPPAPAPAPSPTPTPTPQPTPTPTPTPSPAPAPTPDPTPDPTPAPNPTPAPTPPPPPPPSAQVELDGNVSSLRGSCPDLIFNISGTTVFTDGQTKYREGNCKHVEPGRRVFVVGDRQADERVKAERIDIKQKGG